MERRKRRSFTPEFRADAVSLPRFGGQQHVARLHRGPHVPREQEAPLELHHAAHHQLPVSPGWKRESLKSKVQVAACASPARLTGLEVPGFTHDSSKSVGRQLLRL